MVPDLDKYWSQHGHIYTCEGNILLTTYTETSDHSYTVAIRLDIVNEAGDDAEPPTILLSVDYPEAYPDVAPILDITAPEDEEPHRLFNLDEDKHQLDEALNAAVEENMGMPMIFTLVSTLKETAESLIASRQEVEKQAHIKRVMAIEAEENKKFHGTPVTVESFNRWREAFRKEQQDKEDAEKEEERLAELKRNRGKETEVKLTGRQLWERGLAGKGGEEGEDFEEMARGMEKVGV